MKTAQILIVLAVVGRFLVGLYKAGQKEKPSDRACAFTAYGIIVLVDLFVVYKAGALSTLLQ